MQFITLLDYLLLPVYIFIIYTIADSIKDRDYPEGHPWRPYFIPGLVLKIGGGIGIGLIYQYYYGSGDTAMYWIEAKIINSAADESIIKWLNLLFHIPEWYDGEYSKYTMFMPWYESISEFMVGAIAAIVGVFTLTKYLLIAVVFASLSFTGMWALFKTFATQYPQYTKYIAWSCLFIPSTIMWGSGLFKDTICMFGIGWLTYGIFRLLIYKDFRPHLIIMTVFSFYLIANIKLYILLGFLPAMVLWILFTYSQLIPDPSLKMAVKTFVIGCCIGGFLFFSQRFAAEMGEYSLANVAETTVKTSTYIQGVSGEDGSGYDLGPMDASIGSLLKKFPLAVNVTLFRPYIWETRKVFQMINALEASLFLWVTIKILVSVGLKQCWRTIKADPNIQFCLIFTLIFAFAVGLSSGNFGTLSRYRIPCLPFYGMTLVLIYYKNKPLENNILALNFK